MMNIARAEKLDEHEPASTHEAESEIHGIARAESAAPRPQQGRLGDLVGNEAHALVERVSTSSANEIDKLIGQLQTLREFLRNEGQRIQREIADYAHLGDAMLQLTKRMAESMTQLKQTGDLSGDEAA
jgi:hypothetical protein